MTDSVFYTGKDGVVTRLIVAGDPQSGSVWVPVWLVNAERERLGWIYDLGITPSEGPPEDPTSIYRVPRWEWDRWMGSDSPYALVRQAILRQWQVTGYYDGLYREFCPHEIGTKYPGERHVLGYQFGGQSSSGYLPEWRCMVVDRLLDVAIQPGDWHTGTGHSSAQTCVDFIDVQIPN
jgi:hypothetical protein